jgi:hypothetical protein
VGPWCEGLAGLQGGSWPSGDLVDLQSGALVGLWGGPVGQGLAGLVEQRSSGPAG